MISSFVLSLLLLQGPQPLPVPPTADPLLHEGEWIVEVVDNIKVLPDSRVTMNIRGNSITGSASCNTYRGTVSVFDDTIRVSQILRTMKSCDAARMSEESDFFATLRDVKTAALRGRDTLVLTTTDGRTITARRASTTQR